MDVSKGRITLVKTQFNDNCQIVHKFTNVAPTIGDLSSNSPMDIVETGFIYSDNIDCYALDLIVGTMTDECPPCFLNGTIIGGNHGAPFAITVLSNNHKKTIKDVGAIYKDEAGVTFTLMRVVDENLLTFLSENKSKDNRSFDFTKKITGDLIYQNNGNDTTTIKIESQQVGYLCRGIRHVKKQVLAYKNEKWSPVVLYDLDCEKIKFREEFLVINPDDCAKELAKKRPKGGYDHEVDIACFGDAMVDYKVDYNILKDGTILVEFDHKKVQDCLWSTQRGIMSQNKRDAFGGGVYRLIPKTKLITDENGSYDFSTPYPLKGEAFPTRMELTEIFWQDKNSPPDRMIDVFRDENGNDKLCYTCGYLPLYDCVPSVRAKNTTSAFHIRKTRKIYPFVKNGDIETCKGVGYKKYFEPVENGILLHSVNYEDKNYIYVDFYKKGKCEYDIKGSVTLFEKSSDIDYVIKDNKLIVTCPKDNCGNFATFIEQL